MVGALARVQAQREALAALAVAWAAEQEVRQRVRQTKSVTGARLVVARDVGARWGSILTVLGGMERTAANARWREARTAANARWREARALSVAEGSVVDPLLSELAGRWGGMRTLEEFRALEVAARVGAVEAGARERDAAMPGQRSYEVDGLVLQVESDAAEAGRLALVRAARAEGAVVPMLRAWPLVARAAEQFVPSWRDSA